MAVALTVVALGCADRAMVVRAHRVQHPVTVGMTAPEVVRRWGQPASVAQIRTSDDGLTEEWRYPHGRPDKSGETSRVPAIIWLRDGRVIAMLE